MDSQRIGALILAAGLSSRMQGFKPLMPLGDKTLIEHVITLYTIAGIEEVITVTGHRAEELIPVAEAASSRCVVNHHYRDGMFSSIQQGAAQLRDKCDAFFLHPADIPLVRPATIKQVRDTFFDCRSAPICYPQFQSKRGHPPLIDNGLIGHILTYQGEGGMRGLLRSYEQQAIVVNVDDPFIHMDADTPEDLLCLREAYQ